MSATIQCTARAAKLASCQPKVCRYLTCQAARKVECRHILLASDQEAQEAKFALDEGCSFEELARERSLCSSRANGGRIGWVIPGMASSTIEEAVCEAPVGAIVRAQSEGGYHVLEVLAEASEARIAQPGGASSGRAADEAPAARPRATVGHLSVESLKAILDDAEQAERVQLIDVREFEEFQISRIEGFRLYPLSQLSAWLNTIAREMDPERETLVLCHHGVRSLQASHFLLRQGFERVYNVTGGIDAFSNNVDPSVPKY